jgi:hypothetical protein
VSGVSNAIPSVSPCVALGERERFLVRETRVLDRIDARADRRNGRDAPSVIAILGCVTMRPRDDI